MSAGGLSEKMRRLFESDKRSAAQQRERWSKTYWPPRTLALAERDAVHAEAQRNRRRRRALRGRAR